MNCVANIVIYIINVDKKEGNIRIKFVQSIAQWDNE